VSVLVADDTPRAAAAEESFKAAVTITRTSEDDFKSRQVIVSLDGTRVATLLWGDSITLDVQPGPHHLRFYNTLVWKNVAFTVTPGEHAFFEVINRAGLGTMTMTLLFGAGPLYLTVRRMDA
jgi:hypothetical protein